MLHKIHRNSWLNSAWKDSWSSRIRTFDYRGTLGIFGGCLGSVWLLLPSNCSLPWGLHLGKTRYGSVECCVFRMPTLTALPKGFAKNGTTRSAHSWVVGISTFAWPVILIQIPRTATINDPVSSECQLAVGTISNPTKGSSPTNGVTSTPLLRMKSHQVFK